MSLSLFKIQAKFQAPLKFRLELENPEPNAVYSYKSFGLPEIQIPFGSDFGVVWILVIWYSDYGCTVNVRNLNVRISDILSLVGVF